MVSSDNLSNAESYLSKYDSAFFICLLEKNPE